MIAIKTNAAPLMLVENGAYTVVRNGVSANGIDILVGDLFVPDFVARDEDTGLPYIAIARLNGEDCVLENEAVLDFLGIAVDSTDDVIFYVPLV